MANSDANHGQKRGEQETLLGEATTSPLREESEVKTHCQRLKIFHPNSTSDLRIFHSNSTSVYFQSDAGILWVFYVSAVSRLVNPYMCAWTTSKILVERRLPLALIWDLSDMVHSSICAFTVYGSKWSTASTSWRVPKLFGESLDTLGAMTSFCTADWKVFLMDFISSTSKVVSCGRAWSFSTCASFLLETQASPSLVLDEKYHTMVYRHLHLCMCGLITWMHCFSGRNGLVTMAGSHCRSSWLSTHISCRTSFYSFQNSVTKSSNHFHGVCFLSDVYRCYASGSTALTW